MSLSTGIEGGDAEEGGLVNGCKLERWAGGYAVRRNGKPLGTIRKRGKRNWTACTMAGRITSGLNGKNEAVVNLCLASRSGG